jgi:hypothetical protein
MVRGAPHREDPTCPRPPPAICAADVMALYDRCLANRPKARIVISHAAGVQVLTVTCSMPAPAETAAAARRRRRCHRRRRRRGCTITAVGRVPAQPTNPVAATPAGRLASPLSRAPLPSSPPEIISPPAKRTRRQRNEVELLWNLELEGEFLLYPLSCPATPPLRKLTPSLPPRDSPAPPTLPA